MEDIEGILEVVLEAFEQSAWNEDARAVVTAELGRDGGSPVPELIASYAASVADKLREERDKRKPKVEEFAPDVDRRILVLIAALAAIDGSQRSLLIDRLVETAGLDAPEHSEIMKEGEAFAREIEREFKEHH
jgi:RNA processing factor Prp31